MAIRLTLIIAALVLALTGCTKHRSSGRAHKGVAGSVYASSHSSRVGAPVNLLRGSSAPVRTVATSTAAGNGPYKLDSGDRLRITVFGQQNLSRTYPVDASGFVSMPLIGAIEARGVTTFELETRIAGALRQKYVKDPKVTVEVDVNRPFFILGEVRNGGQFPYVAGMTVQKAVAIAGGFTPRARKRKVQLTRTINGAQVSQMVPVSWILQPGDTITVKERFF